MFYILNEIFFLNACCEKNYVHIPLLHNLYNIESTKQELKIKLSFNPLLHEICVPPIFEINYKISSYCLLTHRRSAHKKLFP